MHTAEMNTDEINYLGKKYVPHFVGVFPLNKMPSVLPRVGANFIVNTDTHNLPGEHWLAVSYKNGGFIHAFDPFGFFYPLLFKQSLHRYGKPIKYNTTRFQDVSEKTCGQYCISWLIIKNSKNCFNSH